MDSTDAPVQVLRDLWLVKWGDRKVTAGEIVAARGGDLDWIYVANILRDHGYLHPPRGSGQPLPHYYFLKEQ